MILIDSRIGSKHLADKIPGSMLTRLESADICFDGNDGITVGIELKTVSDAVNCMFTGRLADHQIPLLKQMYDIVYLVIEGVYRPCPKSEVLQILKLFASENEKGVQCGRWHDASHGNQRLLYSSFESWLNSMAVQGGILVRSTSSSEGTAALALSMHNWWQKSEHSSLSVFHQPTGTDAPLSRPTLTRRVAATLPHIGWEKSKAIENQFGTVYKMVNAPESEWLEIDGVGNKIVGDVRKALGCPA